MTDDQTQSFDDAESAAPSESVSDSLPGSVQPDTSHDLPGEQLAAARREPADDYVVADPEAEELTTPDSADAASHIDDPTQLADADQVARTARSSRPVRRAAPLPAAEDDVTDAPDAGTGDPSDQPAIPGAALRPRRRTTETSGTSGAGATAVAVAESTSERRAARKRTARKREVTTIDPDHRVGPVEFTRQSVDELRKVIWPTGEQLMQYFGVVLAFVLFIIAFVGLLDLFFGWSLLKLLGS